MESRSAAGAAVVPRFLVCTILIINIDLIPVIVVSAANIPMSGLNVNIAFLPLPFVIWTQRNSFADMDGDLTEVIIEVQQPVSGTVSNSFDYLYIQPFPISGTVLASGSTKVSIPIPIRTV